MQRECAVCLLPCLRDPVELRACGHRFCRACVVKALQYRTSCPVCRTVPAGIFPLTPSTDAASYGLASTEHFGITLGKADEGVRVLKLTPTDVAHRIGIRRGDIILAINDVPCRTHEEAIEVLRKIKEVACADGQCRARFTVQKPRPGLLTRLLWHRKRG